MAGPQAQHLQAVEACHLAVAEIYAVLEHAQAGELVKWHLDAMEVQEVVPSRQFRQLVVGDPPVLHAHHLLNYTSENLVYDIVRAASRSTLINGPQ